MASITYTRVQSGRVYEARFGFWDDPENFRFLHEQIEAEMAGLA